MKAFVAALLRHQNMNNLCTCVIFGPNQDTAPIIPRSPQTSKLSDRKVSNNYLHVFFAFLCPFHCLFMGINATVARYCFLCTVTAFRNNLVVRFQVTFSTFRSPNLIEIIIKGSSGQVDLNGPRGNYWQTLITNYSRTR